MTDYVFTPQDVEPFLIGLCIYGTGGGGPMARGEALMRNDLSKGRTLRIIDINALADDAFLCSGGNMGSVKSGAGVDQCEMVRGWERSFPLLNALELMEQIKRKKLDALVPFETGAGNTPIILSAAARLGIPVIDADLVGRAAPETQMSSLIGHGVDLYPMCLVDDSGNRFVIMSSDDVTYADEVGRMLIGKGGRFGANSHHPISGAEAKRFAVGGSISRALALGRAVLAAGASGGDGVEAAKMYLGAWEQFRGAISEVEAEEKGGFYLLTMTVRGTGVYAGHVARALVKNELMLLYIDDALRMMFPDYGFMLDPNTGFGIQSSALAPGLDIVLLGKPCHPLVRECMYDEKGIAAFGPGRYGRLNLPYIPIEELRDI